eukprot:jgi/Tetstr1/439465/TSEL_027898.t1
MSGQLGLTRNRTDKYLSYRMAAQRGTRLLVTQNESAAGARLLEVAIDSAGGAVDSTAAVAANLPPAWVDITADIREEVIAVRQKMAELKGIYGKTLLTTFDDHRPDEVTIEVITADITRRFRKAQGRLKVLSQVPGSEDDVKVRTNVQRSLAMELSTLSMEFRKQQKAYLAKVKQTKEGGAMAADPLDQQASKWQWSDEEEDPGMSTGQIQQIDDMSALVLERDTEIAKVMQSIQDLAQIMQDLSVMVIDQGTILDRIDYNMEQVAVKIDEGVKQIIKAEKKQKSSCRILCIMVLFVAVVLMLLVLLVKNVLF